MKILILGGDGYLGWPTAMHLAMAGHDVTIADNYSKRGFETQYGVKPLAEIPMMEKRCEAFALATDKYIHYLVADCTSYTHLKRMIEGRTPDTIIHYAELPSAPMSMLDYDAANATMNNNLNSTLALAHAVMTVDPTIHIIKLGTMGEYGTPNIPIGEGWLQAHADGNSQMFTYPASPGSLYHATKVVDTHLLWLYTKTHKLKVTDVMQGPVYGIDTAETKIEGCHTSFHYDDLFGTVVNRFIAQAAIHHPLTIYGAGGQTRGYIYLQDVMQAITLLCETPAEVGEMRIVNQVAELHSIRSLAHLVLGAGHLCGVGDFVDVINIPNPREELEEHPMEIESQILPALGFEPTKMTSELLSGMLLTALSHKDNIDEDKIMPRHSWRLSPTAVTEEQLCPT